MTAVKTLRDQKSKRLSDGSVLQNQIEIDDPETPLEWHGRWCRESAERRKQAGLIDEEPLTMEEIVTICQEARAERYAEKQKNQTCR